jgi:hypothetical protein
MTCWQISRIKRGILSLRKIKTDLLLAVRVAVEAVQPKAEAKRQAMNLAASGHPIYVYGDPATPDSNLHQPPYERGEVHAGGWATSRWRLRRARVR